MTEGMGLGMKKCMVWILAMMMMLCAGAEEFSNGAFMKLDGSCAITVMDEEVEVIFDCEGTGGWADYTLTVGETEPCTDEIYTQSAPELYAAMLYGRAFFFVGGWGESGDANYHVYEYTRYWSEYGEEYALNRIPGEFCCACGPEQFESDGFNSFRGVGIEDVLGATWFHEQEYVIATNSACLGQSDDPYLGGVFELPLGLYPYCPGTVVQIAQDLPLLTGREPDAQTVVLPEGSYAAIVGSDGECWAYLHEVKLQPDYDMLSGWVRLVPGSYNGIIVGGEEVSFTDYMSGVHMGG